MKRHCQLLGMGLSVVFFAGLLTGCGGKSESASTASETVAAVESQEKSQEESRETETSGQTAEKEP